MTTTPTAAPPLADVQRARDALIHALAVTAIPDAAHLEALAELDAECRARAGGTEPDGLSRLLFLNYHHHLAHHRHPNTPWLYLGEFVDRSEPQPSFLRIWLSMWRGPRRLPTPPA